MNRAALPQELKRVVDEVTIYARAYGLDFFDTIFEMVDLEGMIEVASYGGFPNRYPHWRFGMDFEEMDRTTTYGLSRIYELVLNTDPCYAYLLRSNSLTEQKIVIAHVLGHSDFFKSNQWFSATNRKMLDQMANHAVRVRRIMDRVGVEPVEEFIDACLSLENLLDIHSPFIRREPVESDETGDDRDEEADGVRRLRSKDYMESYINPEAFLQAQREKVAEERARHGRVPPQPVKDVPGFLLEHAPLDDWEAEILAMIREEAYYFAPQRQTKVMNEGWASFWHSTIMTEKALGDGEVVDYAERHAGTMAMSPGSLNPYKLGLEIYRDIEDRWNRGAHGPEYDECQDIQKRARWDLKKGEGRAKIFEVRRVHNDVTFIDAYLTEEFCRRHRFFTYAYDEEHKTAHIQSREFARIKEQLLFSITNFGQPFIYVEDANYANRGELLLHHRHEGFDLKLDWARDTLERLAQMWRRPVRLHTVVDGKAKLLGHDGESWSMEDLGEKEQSGE